MPRNKIRLPLYFNGKDLFTSTYVSYLSFLVMIFILSSQYSLFKKLGVIRGYQSSISSFQSNDFLKN